MPIKYDKLLKLLESNGITSYTLKKDNVIGQATYKKIKDYKNAVMYYEKILDLKKGKEDILQNLYNNIIFSYINLGENEKVFKYLLIRHSYYLMY